MDLEFSEEQQLLREMVRRVCEEHCPLQRVRALEDDPTGYAPEFWKQLAQLGLLGVLIPEDQGGAGQSLLEAAILYEEFGRSLAPSPHFGSAVMGAGVLLAAGSGEQQRRWLAPIAAGDARLAPAWLEPKGSPGPRGVRLAARPADDGVRLSGKKRHVPFASTASRLLVLARSGPRPEDVDLFLVDPSSPGITLTQQRSLAADAQYEVVFEDVPVPGADRIGPERSGWAAWRQVWLDGIVLLAAQAVGGAARSLEITVEYAKQRHQFGKPLGAFQAISHYLADAQTAVDGATTLVHQAASARATGRSIERLAPMAKLFACRTFRDVTAMAQQVWGGVGFTTEYDIQLYFRRAKQLELSWGDTRYLEEQVARAVLDAPAA